ncbi:LIM homeobox transcription factor 1-alpha [Tyrophagus putrescentiae]|nr:LIM homeobox transcription factor 1-alpha [Tyrophagus putrescentiae]
MEQSIPVIWSEVMQEWVLIDVMPGSFSPLRPSAVFTLPIESSSSPSSSLITSAQPQLLTNTSVSNFEVLTGQSSTVDSSVYQELTSAEFVASDNQAFVVQGSVDQEGANGGDDGNSGEELQYLVLGRMQHVPVPDQALNLSSSDVGVDPNCWGDSCPCKAYESQVLYSVKCNGCFRSIGPSELVMRVAGGAIYHTDCFTCGRCGRHLTKGDEFALRRGGLLCRRDLDACLLDVSLSGGNSVGGNGVSIAGAVEPNSPDGCAAGENSGNGNGRAISPGGGGNDLGTLMGDTVPTVEHCGQLEAAGNYSPRTSCEIVLGVANIKSEIANTNSSSSPYSPSNSNTGGQQNSQQSQSVQPPA